MGIFNFLFGMGKKEGRVTQQQSGESEFVTIEIPAKIIYKEMAIYTAVSLIANAISGCGFNVYKNNKKVKNEDWYRLNIEPNKNENASFFWNKVINKTIREKKAVVIEHKGELHCVEGFTQIQDAIKGDNYENVMMSDGKTLNRTYKAEEIYIFQLESKDAMGIIDTLWKDYGEVYQAAARAFKDTNARRYKLKLDSIKAGDEQFVNDWESYIKNQIESYMKNEYSTYVEYEGYNLEREETPIGKSAEDLVRIKKDMFETVGQALKIPTALMSGNITSVKDICNVFLTFGVDPWADMIKKVLNKTAGKKNVLAGNYYSVNTGKIKHRDPIEDAQNIGQLISSGFANIDEVREEEDYEPKDEWWSTMHWLTKNWAKLEDVANGLEGGEENERSK